MSAGVDVELRAVTRRFGGVSAVESVDLEVLHGEFLSLLGPSGCGKTTTLRLIAGFERPDAGSIHIGGEDVTGVPPYRRPVNTVFQSYALFPQDLGDPPWRSLRRVTLPLALPGIVAGSLLVFIPLTGEYLIPAILGGNKTAYTGTLIAQQFSEAHDWPLGSAIAVVVIGTMTLVLVAFSRLAVRGEVTDG